MTDDIEARISSLEQRVSLLEERLTDRPLPHNRKSLSITEVLRASKAKTDVEKVLVIGYYMEKFGGRQNFTVKELSDQFLLAKEQQPSNLNQSVNQNILKGFLMEWPTKREGQKCWGVTSSGDERVASMLRSTEPSENPPEVAGPPSGAPSR